MKTFNRICLFVGVALMGWMIHTIGAGEVARLLRDVGMWFGVVIAIAFAGTLAETRAQQLFLGPAADQVSYGRVLQAKLAGQAINLVTPGAAVGEATKVSVLVSHGAPQRRVLSSVILFNVVLLLLACAVATIGPLIAIRFLDLPTHVLHGVAVASVLLGSGVLLLLVLVRRGALGSLLSIGVRLRILKPAVAEHWRAAAMDVDRQVRELRREDPRRFWRGVAWMVLARLLSLCEAWVILHALGARSDLLFTLLIASVNTLVGWMAGVVPLGIGAAEGGGWVLFTLLEQSPSLGVMMQLVQRMRKLVLIGVGLAVLAWSQSEPWMAALRARRAASPPSPATDPPAT